MADETVVFPLGSTEGPRSRKRSREADGAPSQLNEAQKLKTDADPEKPTTAPPVSSLDGSDDATAPLSSGSVDAPGARRGSTGSHPIPKELRQLTSDAPWSANGSYWGAPIQDRRRGGICGAVEHLRPTPEQTKAIKEGEEEEGTKPAVQQQQARQRGKDAADPRSCRPASPSGL